MRKRKRAALYVRVSTAGQNTKVQEAELKAYVQARGWEVIWVYADRGISGTKDDRPALKELMSACRQRKVDVVLVWKFDRFARSLRHLVSALEEFKRLQIDFISATEGVDTTVPSGELVFGILAAIGQFERSLISERVKAGLAEAVRNGKAVGRPPIKRLSALEVKAIRAGRRKGLTFRKLAGNFGSSVWAVHQACQR